MSGTWLPQESSAGNLLTFVSTNYLKKASCGLTDILTTHHLFLHQLCKAMNLLFDRQNRFNGIRADLRLCSSLVWQQRQLLLTCLIACCCCCCCCCSLVMITTSLLTSTALLRRGSGSGCEQTTVLRSMFCPIHTVLQDQQRNAGHARNICLPCNLLIFLLRPCQQAT